MYISFSFILLEAQTYQMACASEQYEAGQLEQESEWVFDCKSFSEASWNIESTNSEYFEKNWKKLIYDTHSGA